MNLFQSIVNSMYNSNGVVDVLGGKLAVLVELSLVVFFAAYVATKMDTVRAYWGWATVSILSAVAWVVHLLLVFAWEGIVWPERGIDLLQLGYGLIYIPWPLTHLLIVPVLINGYSKVVDREKTS